MHPRPADQLEQLEDLLALAEAYQNIEIAPSSSAAVPSQMRCEWIRFSSQRHMRIHVAFRGISSASSFSIASTKTSSLFWYET